MRQSFECRHIHSLCFGRAYADIVEMKGGVYPSRRELRTFLCHSSAVSKCCVMSLRAAWCEPLICTEGTCCGCELNTQRPRKRHVTRPALSHVYHSRVYLFKPNVNYFPDHVKLLATRLSLQTFLIVTREKLRPNNTRSQTALFWEMWALNVAQRCVVYMCRGPTYQGNVLEKDRVL